jgi:hypothetical protein
MKNLVDYADKKKIELVPAVSTLGHAEHFLNCPELEHLAELRGGRDGRFSKFKHVFCPSLKETNEFLEHYLTEVAELFPSDYFHAGFDEAWDIGYCDLCMKRLETETQSDIFAKQIIDIHGILSKKLKKKMIIWDDLFDIYHQAIGKIPRNIILCSWHYDHLVGMPAGHCGGPQTDVFPQYDKLGFKYLFAPASFSVRNVESFSQYALKRNPLGALLTVWEGERSFLFSEYPTIAYAGVLWSGQGGNAPDTELQDNAVREITGCGKKEQVSLIKAILSSREMTLPTKVQAYLRGPLSQGEYERNYFLDIAKAALASYASNALKQMECDVLEDLSIRVELESVFFELRKLITSLYSPEFPHSSRKGLRINIEHAVCRLQSARDKRRQQWDRHRKGIAPCGSDRYLDAVIKMISEAEKDSAKAKALCKVTFPFGTGNTEIFIRYRNNEKWNSIASGTFSQAPFSGFFHFYFPIYSDEIPEAVRIEACGYVGTGISFLAVETDKYRLIPDSIASIEGDVHNPESMIEEGRDWCFFGEGEQCARRKFLNPNLAKMKNSIDLNIALKQ